MPQQAIRFPDELHAAVKAEAERRGKPHTFTSVLLEWATVGQSVPQRSTASPPPTQAPTPVAGPSEYRQAMEAKRVKLEAERKKSRR